MNNKVSSRDIPRVLCTTYFLCESRNRFDNWNCWHNVRMRFSRLLGLESRILGPLLILAQIVSNFSTLTEKFVSMPTLVTRTIEIN